MIQLQGSNFGKKDLITITAQGMALAAFLGVHEGPQSISKSPVNVSLKPGMIISNEPGYYKDKSFGIRIENLVLVKQSSLKNFYDFETLSLFPYEQNLINKSLLKFKSD